MHILKSSFNIVYKLSSRKVEGVALRSLGNRQ